MLTKIASFWNDCLDLFFPKICPACRRPVTGTEYQLCTECLLLLPRLHAGGLSTLEVESKFSGFKEVKTVQAFLEYHAKGKVRSLLRSIKYEGNKDLASFLGRIYGLDRVSAGMTPAADLLVPVPLHPRKEKERGYNQSEFFAAGLSEALSVPLDKSLLVRNVYTRSQTGKTRSERIEAMQGVFGVRPGVNLNELRIILADDVLTTGATLEACIEELVRRGCREIHIMTIAAARD